MEHDNFGHTHTCKQLSREIIPMNEPATENTRLRKSTHCCCTGKWDHHNPFSAEPAYLAARTPE